MAIVSAADLEGRFQENDSPTSADFAAVFDSFLHKVSAAGTALAVRSLGAGAVGSAIFNAGTTAAARGQFGFGAVGDSQVDQATTASAQTVIGGGAAGRTVFQAAATASAINNLGLIATTANMSAPTDTSSRFVTPGLQHYHPLMPKGWVTFNGAGTVSIKESWNVASIGDIGAGVYRVNWGSAFANGNYGIAGISRNVAGAAFEQLTLISTAAGNPAAGDVQVVNSSVAATPGAISVADSSTISVWAISR